MAKEQDNRLWRRYQSGKKITRPPDYSDPNVLLHACIRYFEWNEENPLEVTKLMVVNNRLRHPKVKKPRPMTIQAMCAFLGISRRAWQMWRDREDLAPVIEKVEQIIFSQKFEWAAVGMFNSALIARELGLADKSELSGPDGGPIRTEVTSARDILASKLASLAAPRADEEGSVGTDGESGG